MATITIQELMPLVFKSWEPIADFSVGFVKAIGNPNSTGKDAAELVLAGNGVLVTAFGKHAILTADHVLKNLPQTDVIGLVLLSPNGKTPPHQLMVEWPLVELIRSARAPMTHWDQI